MVMMRPEKRLGSGRRGSIDRAVSRLSEKMK
jgi:hypothetical protein